MIASFALASTLWLAQAPAPARPGAPATTATPAPGARNPPAPGAKNPPANPPPPSSTSRALPPAAPPPKGTVTPVTQSLVDWSKVGPMARKPRNEALIKKELELFVMQEDQLAANRDYEGRLSRIDFPLLMVTDDARGVIEAQSFTREQYFSEMKPFWDAQPPVKHRLTISVLSDALATIIDDYTFTVGARRITARASALVVKRGGQWKWKSMTEAGWSGVGAPAAAPPPQAAPPAATPPAQAAPPAPQAAPPTRTLRAPPALEPVAPQPQPAPAAPPPAPAPAPPAPRR